MNQSSDFSNRDHLTIIAFGKYPRSSDCLLNLPSVRGKRMGGAGGGGEEEERGEIEKATQGGII